MVGFGICSGNIQAVIPEKKKKKLEKGEMSFGWMWFGWNCGTIP